MLDVRCHLMIPTRQILGLRFFKGDVDEAVAFMHRHGGYLVAPSGTCFARLREDESYRRAIVAADLAIADSGLMVLLWRLLRRENVQRISGLIYLKALLELPEIRAEDKTFWVLPSERAREKAQQWLRGSGFACADEDFYIAPMYDVALDDECSHGSELALSAADASRAADQRVSQRRGYSAPVIDHALLARIEARRPRHVIIGIGGGPQEKLGYYLRENLSYRPAIHCIGAALGFITGDQIRIPGWADRVYLGWLLRLLAQPRIFIPRLSRACELPWLIWRYGKNLPPIRQ
jgi:UDP-N-acetyl-D-mannosaminuronic acid transferase (WecB/TagA/CpsF family)